MEDVHDQRHYIPKTIPALSREFPDWEIWRGINLRYNAGLRPAKRLEPDVNAEDLEELRELIIQWRWRHGQTPR